MATGDDALAAGMQIMTGTEPANTIDTEMNLTRDFIAQRTNSVTPVAKGGTGATTAAAARSALGITAANIPSTGTDVQGDLNYLSSVKLTRSNDQYNADFGARDARINDAHGRIDSLDNSKRPYSDGYFGGDVSASNVFARGASAATSGWTTAYINADGRLAKGASSERYKKWISEIDPDHLGDIFPTFQRFQMRSQEGSPSDNQWKYGYIAERLAENPDTERFVVYNFEQTEDGTWSPTDQAESIDFISLLMAQAAQLHQRAAEAEARFEALEARVAALEAPME